MLMEMNKINHVICEKTEFECFITGSKYQETDESIRPSAVILLFYYFF